MLKLNLFLVFFGFISRIYGNYNGPFLFWGLDELKNIELSALEAIDDKVLRDLYTESSAIIMFIRNGTTKLNSESYPEFKQIIDSSKWSYISQHFLSSDPVDYNVNAEVIHLVGPLSQQDVEISALYRDAVLNYGTGKVLGILATKWNGHSISKREASEAPPPASPTPYIVASSTSSSEDETFDEGFTYYAAGKAILYTTSPPILKTLTENNGEASTNNTEWSTTTIELLYHSFVISDERDQLNRLIITFKVDDGKLTLRFRFPIVSGYWSLTSVEVEDPNRLSQVVLTVDGETPTAPIGFSYHCSKSLIFRNENKTTSLVIENIQVQTAMGGATEFSDAFDCIGFTSAPIWSGVFISFIFIVGLSIAINAILEIKPPNRFENSRSKQLTFTIQE